MRLFTSPYWVRCVHASRVALLIFAMLASFRELAEGQGKERLMKYASSYRTIQIDGLSIFYRYREAGPKDGPALLLLHGSGQSLCPKPG